MSIALASKAAEPWSRRMSRVLLIRALRGRGTRSTDWGEALIAEFEETVGRWEAVRWSASGLRVAWRQRRGIAPSSAGAAVAAPPSLRRRLRRYLVIGLVVVVAGVLINWQVATVKDVPSMAMSPTLRPDDKVVVDKLGFRIFGVHYGDVVTIASAAFGPGGGSDDLFRRVAGLPNDTIECRDGRVLRNGQPVAESAQSPRTNCTSVTVPAGSVYVLGDNSDNAIDSRQLGPIPESDITGSVLFRLWPPLR
jgi:signal peptidase I